MKKYISLIIFAFALSGCASLSSRNGMSDDWSQGNINGSVKRIVETNRDLLGYNSRNATRAYDSNTEIRYNTAGYITLMEVHQVNNGQNVTRDEYEYDARGQLGKTYAVLRRTAHK